MNAVKFFVLILCHGTATSSSNWEFRSEMNISQLKIRNFLFGQKCRKCEMNIFLTFYITSKAEMDILDIQYTISRRLNWCIWNIYTKLKTEMNILDINTKLRVKMEILDIFIHTKLKMEYVGNVHQAEGCNERIRYVHWVEDWNECFAIFNSYHNIVHLAIAI